MEAAGAVPILRRISGTQELATMRARLKKHSPLSDAPRKERHCKPYYPPCRLCADFTPYQEALPSGLGMCEQWGMTVRGEGNGCHKHLYL